MTKSRLRELIKFRKAHNGKKRLLEDDYAGAHQLMLISAFCFKQSHSAQNNKAIYIMIQI